MKKRVREENKDAKYFIGRPKYLLKPMPSSASSEVCAPGFHVFPNVFSDIHEALLTIVHKTAPSWTDYRYRQAKNYGPPYDLHKRRFLFGPEVPKGYALPRYVNDSVVPRLKRLLPQLRDFSPNQLTVGLYRIPGQSHILPHNDCENAHIGTAVVGVCLGAPCTMTLILRRSNSGVGRDVKQDIMLPRGAVYVMSGDSLRVWHHAIFPGKTIATRTSLTFRDVFPHTKPSTKTNTAGAVKTELLSMNKIA